MRACVRACHHLLRHIGEILRGLCRENACSMGRKWTGINMQPGDLATVHYRLGLANPSTLEPVKTGERGGLTYLVVNSSHVLTVDYTLHGGGTEAIVETGGNGPNTFRRVRVTRRPVNSLAGYGPVRLLASNADGFHSSCVVHGPTLEDSEFAFTGDDLLNIHSRIDIVLQVLSATSDL